MAVKRKPFKKYDGEIDPSKEIVYSDLGFSLIDIRSGIFYPWLIFEKKGLLTHYIEFTDEAGQFPEERMEKEIEVI